MLRKYFWDAQSGSVYNRLVRINTEANLISLYTIIRTHSLYMCPSCSRSRTHAFIRTLAILFTLDTRLLIIYNLLFSEEPSIMTHQLSAFSLSFSPSLSLSLAIIHTFLGRDSLWRALTGSFFNALAVVEPRISHDQWLNNKKKKYFDQPIFLSFSIANNLNPVCIVEFINFTSKY